MTINDPLSALEGYPIVDWNPGDDLDPAQGIRLRVNYEAPADLTAAALVAELAATPGVEALAALSIGPWAAELFERNPLDVVTALLAARDRFPALRHLFVGDIIMEENEISWIQQCDLGPLLNGFPALLTLGVRGGNSLAFTDVAHDALRSLTVQTGGLGKAVIAQIARAKLPSLERLELWLGEPNYGGDAGADDVLPFLSGRLFPKLRYLGLCDSMVTDKIAQAVANAPALAQLETLDLSMGTLGDEGAEALLASPHVAQLKSLNLRHNFLSEAMAGRLVAALGAAVDVGSRQVPSTYGETTYRFVEVAE